MEYKPLEKISNTHRYKIKTKKKNIREKKQALLEFN